MHSACVFPSLQLKRPSCFSGGPRICTLGQGAQRRDTSTDLMLLRAVATAQPERLWDISRARIFLRSSECLQRVMLWRLKVACNSTTSGAYSYVDWWGFDLRQGIANVRNGAFFFVNSTCLWSGHQEAYEHSIA